MILAIIGLIFLGISSVSASFLDDSDRKLSEFKEIDKNNDDKISIEEFFNTTESLKHWLFFDDAFNEKIYENVVNRIFKNIDTNNDSYLDFEEYCLA